jgi:replication factor C small subunit
MALTSDLFTEKFRPKTLENLIAPPRIKKEFEKGLIQNLLLYGTAGTGKTSTLFILAKNHTYKYINASSEGRIDTIREDIADFCSGISLMDDHRDSLKCIILDEIDGASEEFFKALRSVMERYSKVARFIASCNYIHKIPEPVQSRFNCVSYDPINTEEEKYLSEEYQKRIGIILKAAKIEYTGETLQKFVKNDFPDMRSILNKVQGFYNQGLKELDPKFFNINFNYQDLFELCFKGTEKPYENYKLVVSEYSSRIDEALTVLGTDLPEYIKNNHPDKIDKLPMIIISVAEYQYQKQFTIDPMITLLAAIFKIQTILK